MKYHPDIGPKVATTVDDSRKAVIRFRQADGTEVTVELHPLDLGPALASMRPVQPRSADRRARRERGSNGTTRPAVGEARLPTTEQIRGYLAQHPHANVAAIARDLMDGAVISAFGDKRLYDQVYIRLKTARSQISRGTSDRSSRANPATAPPPVPLTDSADRWATPAEAEAVLDTISTAAAVEYIRDHPQATVEDFLTDVVHIRLHSTGPTRKAYKRASTKVWYARAKNGLPRSLRAARGRP